MKQILERWEKFLESYGKKIFVWGDGESEENKKFSEDLIRSLVDFTMNSSIRVKKKLLPLLRRLADEKAQGKMTYQYLKELEPPRGPVYRGRVGMSIEMVEKEGLFKIPYDKLRHGGSWLIPGGVFTPRQDDITSWSYSEKIAWEFATFQSATELNRAKVRALEKAGTPYFMLVMIVHSKQPGFMLNHKNISALRDLGEEEVLYIGGKLPLRAVKVKYFDPAKGKQTYSWQDNESFGNLAESKDDHDKSVIQEGFTDILYQYRSPHTILKILQKDSFFPSVGFGTPSEVDINKGYKYYLSFARNLRGTYHQQGKMAAYMVLDGRKLGYRFKGSAVDYWQWGHDVKKTEVEDRLFTNKPVIKDANQYIESIHVSIPIEMKSSTSDKVYPNQYRTTQIETLKELDAEAKKKEIPIYFYDDSGAYRMKNTKKAISLDEWEKELPADQIEDFTSTYKPGPLDTSRIDAIGKAIEAMLMKKQNYYELLDSISEEEAKYLRGRLFYSGDATDVARRLEQEIKQVQKDPAARGAIDKIAKALRKLKLNLRQTARALYDAEGEARKKRRDEESAKWEASRKRREEEVAKWEAQQKELEK